MKATCTLCDWTQKARGVYHQHNLARIHVRLQHPAEFELIKTHEECVRTSQAQMVKKFGRAVKPLNMNLVANEGTDLKYDRKADDKQWMYDTLHP